MSSLPVIDLHCDLLLYLAGSSQKDPHYHPEARCSLPQLKQGGVWLQTLALYSETKKGSRDSFKKQWACYKQLAQHGVKQLSKVEFPQLGDLHVIPAIENASLLCEEDDPLEVAFEQLEELCSQTPVLYLSLTWNTENRFGGGNLSQVGLKPDGERLLEFMSGKNIAIDFSHTSDWLANDILNAIDKKGLELTPIASHSNFRSICNNARNLPDALATEIACRGGVIGFNLVRKFIGEPFEESCLKHLEHARELNILSSVCFGADFFHDGFIHQDLKYLLPFFDPGYDNAGCYPKLQKLFSKTLSKTELEGICYQNFQRYLEKVPCG